MYELITKLAEAISVSYVVTVMLLSYLVIRLWFSGTKSGVKKALVFAVAIVIGAVFLALKIEALHALIQSFTVVVVLYDYIIKYLLNLLYKLK